MVDKLEKQKILSNGKKFCLSDFEVLKELGSGAYAKVYLANHIKENRQYALKTISKYSICKENKLYQIHLETDLMLMLDNPFIAKLYGAFEENNKLILVMDLYQNGDLFDFISANSKILNFRTYEYRNSKTYISSNSYCI